MRWSFTDPEIIPEPLDGSGYWRLVSGVAWVWMSKCTWPKLPPVPGKLLHANFERQVAWRDAIRFLGHFWRNKLHPTAKTEWETWAANYCANRPDKTCTKDNAFKFYAESCIAARLYAPDSAIHHTLDEANIAADVTLLGLKASTNHVKIRWDFTPNVPQAGNLGCLYMIDPARVDSKSPLRFTRICGVNYTWGIKPGDPYTDIYDTRWPLEDGVTYHFLARSHAGWFGVANYQLCFVASG